MVVYNSSKGRNISVRSSLLPPPFSRPPLSVCIVVLVGWIIDGCAERDEQEGLLQKAAEMTRGIPWEETLTVGDVPLELEDVHDDLKR